MASGKKKKAKRKALPRATPTPPNPSAVQIPANPRPTSTRIWHSAWIIPLIILCLVCLQVGLTATLYSDLAAGIGAADWQIVYILVGQSLAGIVAIIIYPDLTPGHYANQITAGVLLWLLSCYVASIAYTLTDLAGALLVFGVGAAALVSGSATRLVHHCKPRARWTWLVWLAPIIGLAIGVILPTLVTIPLDWRWVFRSSLLGCVAALFLCWWVKATIAVLQPSDSK